MEYSNNNANKNFLKPLQIHRLYIPDNILKETEHYLKEHGLKGMEGLVFWSGILTKKNQGVITSCIYPKQKSSSISVDVDLNESARIHYLLFERNEFLFVQVHSHPGSAFHSIIDDNYPMTHKPGFFSIVVSSYALYGLKGLSGCEVFEYQGNGKWRRLAQKEINNRFVIRRDG